MFSLGKEANYRLSNKLTTTKLYVSNSAKSLTKQLFAVTDVPRRQELGQALLDELSLLAEIPPVRLTISSANQAHKKRGGRLVYKQYGYYKPDLKYIYITNHTAVRGTPLAPKTFLDTLLHEWMHHYDTYRLRLHSIHSKGFYARLSELKEKVGYFLG